MARQRIELAPEEAEELNRRARATTVSVRGRRRAEIILLGAQQQASQVSPRIIENCSVRVLGRTGSLELSQQLWGFLSSSAKRRVENLLPNEKLVYEIDFRQPMEIRAPYGGGIHGALYHSQSVEAYYAHAPGLKIVAPSTPADAKGLLTAAIRDPDPVLVLEHKRTYRAIRGPVPDGDVVVPIGKAAIARPGSDVTVLAYGMMLHESLAAAATLA